MATASLLIPRNIRKGDVVTLKAIISHPMETGYRRDISGASIPRDIIRAFSCSYDGDEIFRCAFHQAISANPLVAFTTVATKTAPITFTWIGDRGFRHTERATLVVGE